MTSRTREIFKQFRQMRNEIKDLQRIVKTLTKELKEQKDYTKTQIEPRLQKQKTGDD